jgi:hypothetical protein
MRLANKIDISNIAPWTGQEPDILLARNPLSDAERHQMVPCVPVAITVLLSLRR